MRRTLVIGDIHGCWDELRDLFERVGLTDEDTVVSVGDLVDRGPDPGAVVQWFRQRAGAVVVCGNHERKHVRGVLSRSQEITRLQLGASYGDDVAWMGTLPYAWEGDGVRVVHASVIPGVPLAETPEDILCGTTSGSERLERRLGAGRWWHELYEEPVPVVFGHHVVREPLVREGRVYGIDTGACHGARLTGLLLPAFELVSVPARGDHWRRVQRSFEVPVLASQPWERMTFEQLDRKVAQLGAGASVEGRAWLASVASWAEAVRAALPSLAEALDAAVAELQDRVGEEGFVAAALSEPLSTTLIRRRAGRLSDGHLGCSGPGEVLRLAEGLGRGLPERPAAPAG